MKITFRFACANATFTLIYISYFLVLCFSYSAHAQKRLCHVHEARANCSGHGHELTYIPKLGDRIKDIAFDHNYLPNVNVRTFLNISVHGIIQLSIRSNAIQNISANSFTSFVHLEMLDISGNNIPTNQLRRLLRNLATLPEFDKLYLNLLSLGGIPQDLFSEMRENALKVLSLRHNGIQNISKEMFQSLTSLKLLDLNYNNIHKLQLPILKQLNILHLNYNRLKRFPDFCNKENINQIEPLAPVLNELLIRGNRIAYINNESLACLANLTFLQITENRIVLLPNNILSVLPNIKKFDFKNMKVRDLQIEPNALNSLSLQTLIMSNSVYANKLLISPVETFAHVPNLKYLDFGSIDLGQMSHDVTVNMFQPLTKLTYFSLWGSKLGSIPDGLFANKHYLLNINLCQNLLTSISHIPFQNIYRLEVLELRANNIRQIEQSMFSEKTFSHLHVLDLSDNKFVCQCDLQWFIDWLRNRKKHIYLKYYPQGYVCVNPAKMRGKPLSDVTFTYRECHPWSMGFWIGVIGGPSLCLLVIIVTILYRNRWNMKHYIFLMKKRRNYVKIEGFLYDGFVGYSQHDFEWVMEYLLPVLETQEGYKLCIADRNFKPGIFIHDNIIKCMDKSRKIIIILTNEFAKSNWCTYELKLGHLKHIRDETELIIIMLKKPEARYMNKSLKLLLETTTYIEWTDDEIGRQLFWEKLSDSMKQ